MYDPYYQTAGWAAGGLIFGLLHLLFWIIVLLFLLRLFRGHHRGYRSGWGHSFADPLQIAKARYAKGEITKDELEEIKKTLA